jgi:hypothetical protein
MWTILNPSGPIIRPPRHTEITRRTRQAEVALKAWREANGQCHTSNESSPHKAVEEFRLTYCGDSKTKYFMKFGPEMDEAANAMQASRPLKFPTRANPGWERVSRVRCVLITFQNQSVVNPAYG